MNNYFKGFVLAATLGPIFLLSAAFAYAQTPAVGLQIKPAVVEDNVAPGETHEYSLTVTNLSGTTKTLYVLSQDIKGVDDQGRPIFAAQGGEVTGFELSSWISLPVTQFNLDAGASKTIPFSVRVPGNASPGSHFASVFFSDHATQPTTNGTGVGFNVGAIVSLRIAGDIVEEASLREFSTSKLIYPNANVDFSAKIDNSGNVLVQPTGVIEITNMFGKQVANIAVNTDQASVFPKADRTFTANWTGSGLSFGRYEVVGSFVYGTDERKTISGTTSFWVLPLVPIGIVLGGFLILVLAAYFMMRSYIRRKLRQMGASSRADTDLYNRRSGSSSRLVVVMLVVILVCVLFLMALFLLFA
jgi:hypothetical protein